MNMKMLDTIGGRKFIFAVGIVAVFTLLVLVGKADAEKLESIAIWALAIFSAANVGQKAIK